jgi:hypothetical protein
VWHKIVSISAKAQMMENKNNEQQLNNPSQMAGPHRDRQGIDKAPGEEQREGSIENVVADTQKGKNKVDGDPTQESDQPINQQ